MNFNCLYRDEVDEELLSFCVEQEIKIVAYRPISLRGGIPLRHPILNEIAAAHNASPAQVSLAWLLQMGTLPIPKAIHKSHR